MTESQSSGLVTLQESPKVFTPNSLATSAAACSICSLLRSTSTMSPPSLAIVFAIALPRPRGDAAPVTSATFSFELFRHDFPQIEILIGFPFP